jgi:glycosyltransferase involved in cell wall biosynthesis
MHRTNSAPTIRSECSRPPGRSEYRNILLRRVGVLQVGKFYPPVRGGMESHLETLCQELQREADVSVLVAQRSAGTIRENVHGIPVTRLRTALRISGASVCPSMARHIRSAGSAEIVHIHVPNPPAVLSYLASRHKGRLVVTYHSDLVRQRRLGRMFEPIQERMLRRADAILVASPDYLNSSPSLRPHLDRCHVIPLGIRLDHPLRDVTVGQIEAVRERYGSRIVLSVGRQVYYKGFEYLIEAMRDVRGHLLLVGEGPLAGELRKKIQILGLTHRVTMLGAVSTQDLRLYYQSADIFVLPSVTRTEAFGLVQVEAMAAGLPVVNTRLDSGVPFVSLHGITGLTVPPRDPAALAEALEDLLSNPEKRAAFGRAARHRANTEFDAGVMARRTLEVYGAISGAKQQLRAAASA